MGVASLRHVIIRPATSAVLIRMTAMVVERVVEEEVGRPNMDEREDAGLGVAGLYHLLKSDKMEVMGRQQSARPEVVEARKPRDSSLDGTARHSLKSQVSITSNSEYLAWQNSQLLDSAVSLLEMANCRAKKYYVLAFMDGTIGDGGEADERGKQHHVMFERVTPLMAKDPQGLPTVIFSISLKTLRRNEATIHRSLPQFLDLHRTLLLLHPPSIDADFSFLHTEKLHQLDTKSLAELSRSLLDLLNHLTTVDSVLFSEELHSFLFLKDAADFTPLKPSQVAKADDERRIHPKSSSKSSNRLKFDIASHPGPARLPGGGVKPRGDPALPGGDPSRPQSGRPLPSASTSHRASTCPEPQNGYEAVGREACSSWLCQGQVSCLTDGAGS